MLQLFEYDLPFRSPFRTASAVYKNRRGILIHYKNSRTDVVVEASPLPGLSKESFDDVKQALLNQQKFIFCTIFFELSGPFDFGGKLREKYF